MKKEYSISIIIPIYNSEKYIEECANSLFCQNLHNIEYIFVDDGSIDNSVAIIETLLKFKYYHLKDHVHILKLDENRGIANARNVGLSNAHGEYIGFVDSDDWVEVDMFSELYKKAIETDADIIGCSFIKEYTNHRYLYTQPYSELTEDNIRKLLTGELFPSLWCEIVKCSLYEDNKISFISGVNMGEDLLVNLKLFVYAKKISFINKALYHYRHSNHSICVVRSYDSIMNDIKVASLIESFLVARNLNLIFYKEILGRKFYAKLPLLSNQNYRDIKLWRNIFQDSNKYILSYTRLDWKMKLEYWLIAKKLTYLAIGFKYFLFFQSRIKKHLSLLWFFTYILFDLNIVSFN